MNDTFETAVEAASEVPTIAMTRTTALAVAGFATYGAFAAIRDGRNKVKSIIENRKAKKAAKVVETDTPQQ
jgi:hypothetical protein